MRWYHSPVVWMMIGVPLLVFILSQKYPEPTADQDGWCFGGQSGAHFTAGFYRCRATGAPLDPAAYPFGRGQ